MSLFDANWAIQVEKLLPPVVREADFILDGDDFKVGDSENQVIHFLIESEPGSWKEFPPVGVGIWRFLQGQQGPQELQRAIKVQMKADVFPDPYVNARGFPLVLVNAVDVDLTQIAL